MNIPPKHMRARKLLVKQHKGKERETYVMVVGLGLALNGYEMNLGGVW
jgi:hypothetical protein